jgi:hypothetical protein
MLSIVITVNKMKQRGRRKLLEVVDMFIVLILVMASSVYTCQNESNYIHICNFMYINYLKAIKFLKIR